MGMHLKAIIALVAIFMWLSPGYAAEDSRMLFFANSQDEIANHFQTGKLQRFDFDGDELLTVAHDVGSGVFIYMLYIYTGSDVEGWSLLAFHRSFASDIRFRIDPDMNEFVALSKSGRILLKLPHESLQGDHQDQLLPPRGTCHINDARRCLRLDWPSPEQ